MSALVRVACNGILVLGGVANCVLSPAGGFLFLVLGFFSVFFGVVRRRWRLEVRIRPSPPYPCFGGAPSTRGGRAELFVWPISWDTIGFLVCCCGFRFDSSDLRFSSLALVLWNLIAATFCLSMISFVRLWWWRGTDILGLHLPHSFFKKREVRAASRF
jgi:hypothetical protein